MLVTDDNIDLVGLLASLSIKEIIIELITKIIEEEANYKLLLSKYLLNREVYFLVTSISKKKY